MPDISGLTLKCLGGNVKENSGRYCVAQVFRPDEYHVVQAFRPDGFRQT